MNSPAARLLHAVLLLAALSLGLPAAAQDADEGAAQASNADNLPALQDTAGAASQGYDPFLEFGPNSTPVEYAIGVVIILVLVVTFAATSAALHAFVRHGGFFGMVVWVAGLIPTLLLSAVMTGGDGVGIAFFAYLLAWTLLRSAFDRTDEEQAGRWRQSLSRAAAVGAGLGFGGFKGGKARGGPVGPGGGGTFGGGGAGGQIAGIGLARTPAPARRTEAEEVDPKDEDPATTADALSPAAHGCLRAAAFFIVGTITLLAALWLVARPLLLAGLAIVLLTSYLYLSRVKGISIKGAIEEPLRKTFFPHHGGD